MWWVINIGLLFPIVNWTGDQKKENHQLQDIVFICYLIHNVAMKIKMKHVECLAIPENDKNQKGLQWWKHSQVSFFISV